MRAEMTRRMRTRHSLPESAVRAITGDAVIGAILYPEQNRLAVPSWFAMGDSAGESGCVGGLGTGGHDVVRSPRWKRCGGGHAGAADRQLFHLCKGALVLARHLQIGRAPCR